MSTYAIVLDNGGLVIARFLGALLIGNSITFWLFRNVPASDKTWQYILAGIFFYNVATILITVTAILNGITNSISWTTVAVQGLVAASCLYYLLQRKAKAGFA
jgi:hypothetical protein